MILYNIFWIHLLSWNSNVFGQPQGCINYLKIKILKKYSGPKILQLLWGKFYPCRRFILLNKFHSLKSKKSAIKTRFLGWLMSNQGLYMIENTSENIWQLWHHYLIFSITFLQLVTKQLFLLCFRSFDIHHLSFQSISHLLLVLNSSVNFLIYCVVATRFR